MPWTPARHARCAVDADDLDRGADHRRGGGQQNLCSAQRRGATQHAIINFFDLCAISLPLQAKLPVGLMLIARNGHDHRLLRIAAATAQLFAA